MNAPAACAVMADKRDVAPIVAPPTARRVGVLTIAMLRADTALLAEWDALAEDASEPNPFAERWYLDAALSALDSDSIRILVVRNDVLVGIMPLITQRRYAGLPIAHVQNWLNHNAFLGTPLVRKGAERAFWAALLDHLDDAAHSGLDQLV